VPEPPVPVVPLGSIDPPAPLPLVPPVPVGSPVVLESLPLSSSLALSPSVSFPPHAQVDNDTAPPTKSTKKRFRMKSLRKKLRSASAAGHRPSRACRYPVHTYPSHT
jgi:hypothetical protein